MTLTVVSFHTRDERYTRYAERLRQSCGANGMPFLILPLSGLGSWVETVSLKAKFMRNCLDQVKGPILWIDADGVVVKLPSLLVDPGAKEIDFAIHAKDRKRREWRPIGREMQVLPDEWPKDDTRWFMTGTIYVNNTNPGRTFLRDWERLATAEPRAYQMLLCQRAWCMCKPRSYWLPETYCDIYGRSKHPVIMHDLASCTGSRKEAVVRR